MSTRARLLLGALLLLPFSGMRGQGADPQAVSPRGEWRDARNPVDVLHYTTRIHLNPQLKILHGEAELDIRMVDAANQFYLHLNGLTVDSVWSSGAGLSMRRVEERLVFDFPQPLGTAAPIRLGVRYHGSPGNDGYGGFFWGDRVIYTVGEGIRTNPPSMLRYWMPSHDEPFDKATLDLFITVPQPLKAYANGTLMAALQNPGTQETTFHYATAQVIAPYLIAITAGSHEVIEDVFPSLSGKDVPLQYIVFAENVEKALADWRRTPEMMQFLEGRFGAYPFERYGMIEVPMRGAMEHQTLTSMSSALLTGTGDYESIVVHELAHQWWGNWVTCADWRDLWLNEGFASYCEALWAEYRGGADSLRRTMSAFASHYFTEAGQRGHFSVYDPEYSWGATVYKKGAWILHMLRFVVGEEAFWRILQVYGTTHAYGSATSRDFIAVAEGETGQSLAWFFEQWLFGAGYPDLHVAWDTPVRRMDSTRVTLIIAQRQRQQPFEMPLEVVVETERGAVTDTVWLRTREDRFEFTVAGTPGRLMIDPHEWLLNRAAIISTPLPGNLPPGELALTQNYPNPFLPQQHGRMELVAQIPEYQAPMKVEICIYNVLGREVVKLAQKNMASGLQIFSWDGRDDRGAAVGSGVYFCQLRAGGRMVNRKFTVIH